MEVLERVVTRISDVPVYNCDYANGASFFMGEWNGSEVCVGICLCLTGITDIV